MILLIDNYDSFTYNLLQYVGEINPNIVVKRNDQISVSEAIALGPSHIILSPGPCTPHEAGICVDLAREIPETIPLLGVCLGHQSIAQAYGASIVRAQSIMHGKTSQITHDDSVLFKGIESPTEATRYHSLIIAPETLPDCFTVTAWCDEIIMAIAHKNRPIYGVQFHPESIMTTYGKQLLNNFISI
ncbi:MAG: aminodeoxychorismate/anthranilate synthase component II [Fibrobacterales bacterium]